MKHPRHAAVNVSGCLLLPGAGPSYDHRFMPLMMFRRIRCGAREFSPACFLCAWATGGTGGELSGRSRRSDQRCTLSSRSLRRVDIRPMLSGYQEWADCRKNGSLPIAFGLISPGNQGSMAAISDAACGRRSFRVQNRTEYQRVMANLNKVMIIGNLTADPELRTTPRGTPLTELRIAVNRVSAGAGEGERREETTFLDVTCWGRTAEIAAQYLAKGRPVFIEGRLQQDTWEDKQTGQRRSRIRIVAENMQLLGAGGAQQGGYGNNSQGGSYQQRGGGYGQQGGGYGNSQGGYANGQGGYQQPQRQQSAPAPAPMPMEDDDDIPF